MKKKKTQSNSTKPNIILLFLVIVLSLSTVLLYINNIKSIQKVNKDQSLTVKKESNNKTIYTNGKNAKDVTQFDTENWKVYEDKEIGIRFKYPKEWGTPSRIFDYCDDNCSFDNKIAWFYRVEFPNSQFTVGGASNNWAPKRGQNILYDFRGFGTEEQRFPSKQDICDIPWMLECVISGNRVRYTTSPACKGESGSGFSYERVMLTELSTNNRINGLAFGGQFIDSQYAISCDEDKNKEIDIALTERKLSSQIMESYDLYGAVFNTLELF